MSTCLLPVSSVLSRWMPLGGGSWYCRLVWCPCPLCSLAGCLLVCQVKVGTVDFGACLLCALSLDFLGLWALVLLTCSVPVSSVLPRWISLGVWRWYCRLFCCLFLCVVLLTCLVPVPLCGTFNLFGALDHPFGLALSTCLVPVPLCGTVDLFGACSSVWYC